MIGSQHLRLHKQMFVSGDDIARVRGGGGGKRQFSSRRVVRPPVRLSDSEKGEIDVFIISF